MENKEKSLVYVGFWRRLASYIFEAYASFIIAVLIAMIIFVFGGIEIALIAWYLISVGLGFIFWIVSVILYYTEGKSLGYWFLGLRIVSEKDESNKAESAQLFVRFIFKYISFFIVFFTIIAESIIIEKGNNNNDSLGVVSTVVMFLAFIVYPIANIVNIVNSSKKQTLYDKWSEVTVIDEKQRSSAWVWVLNLLPIITYTIIIIFIMSSIFIHAF